MNEVLKEDQDITAKALEALWKLHHFDEYKSRNGFCQLFTVANNSNCIVSIQLTKTAKLTLLLPVHEYVRILLWGVVLTCVINSNIIKICSAHIISLFTWVFHAPTLRFFSWAPAIT